MASGSTRPRSTSIATQQGRASAARLTHAIATTSRGTPGSRDPKIERCRIPTNSPPTPARSSFAAATGAAGAATVRRHAEARAALATLQRELNDRNQSAAGSLAEGLDETLTLHRLGLYGVLGRSFKTTNCLESINALVEARCAKVDHWQNSSQRHRWLATALLDIEPRLRKVQGYRHLPKLRAALKRELKIDTPTSKKTAA